MASIAAKIICDSVSPGGVRLTTFVTRIPTVLLAEANTHRALSRSASSARAIPLKTMVKRVEEDGFTPMHWGLAQPGMQARTALAPYSPAWRAAVATWRLARRSAINSATALADDCDVHKQTANRLLSPFSVTDWVVTATDFDNFWALRTHPDTEPHFRALAWLMADAYFTGPGPKPVGLGEWHLPFIRDEERDLDVETLKRCSVARVARTSYSNHDGTAPSVDKDLDLYRRLLNASGRDDPMEPPHLSPMEAVATPAEDPQARYGNFLGWKQHRQEIPNENMKFDYHAAVARGWRDEALAILKDSA